MECVFLGYPPLSKGYMCLDPITNKVYTTCYTLFNENVFPFAINPKFTHAHISFSSDVFDAQWLSVNTTSTDSHSTSSFPSLSSTSVDSFPFDLFQPSFPISCVPGPPSTSLTASSSIPSFIPAATSLYSSSSASSRSIIPVSSTTISDPTDSIVLVNTYPMITRSKLGIHKPKVL